MSVEVQVGRPKRATEYHMYSRCRSLRRTDNVNSTALNIVQSKTVHMMISTE